MLKGGARRQRLGTPLPTTHFSQDPQRLTSTVSVFVCFYHRYFLTAAGQWPEQPRDHEVQQHWGGTGPAPGERTADAQVQLLAGVH